MLSPQISLDHSYAVNIHNDHSYYIMSNKNKTLSYSHVIFGHDYSLNNSEVNMNIPVNLYSDLSSISSNTALHYPTYSEYQEFITINDNTFVVHNVPGDGNCFISSLSLANHGDLSRSIYNRNMICTDNLEHWDH